jgi:hypothetical protein
MDLRFEKYLTAVSITSRPKRSQVAADGRRLTASMISAASTFFAGHR